MDQNLKADRKLSQFGETWVRQTAHGRHAGAVGWYLWAAIAAVTVFALVELLQARA